MAGRDDEDVPRIHRLNIHERGAMLVAINEGPGHLACQDAAEDTIGHSFLDAGCWLTQGSAASAGYPMWDDGPRKVISPGSYKDAFARLSGATTR